MTQSGLQGFSHGLRSWWVVIGVLRAFDRKAGQVAYNYLTLDQSMILIALANYLRDGTIQQHFAADPIIQRAFLLLKAERFFD